jgi:prepilin-type N-terminal cleavage/methylation domain-containing protein
MKKMGQWVTLEGHSLTRSSEHGMTLIEILVALGILAAVSVVFLLGMSTSSKAVMVSQQAVAVDSLAKSELEYVKSANPYRPATWDYQLPSNPPIWWDPTRTLPVGYSGYSVEVTARCIQGHDPDNGIQQITVTVTHDEKVFTLVGYKVKPGE